MYNLPLIATIAYLGIGAFLTYCNNKITLRILGRPSSPREDVIILFLWGIFTVMSIFQHIEELYRSKTNKDLDTFEAIEADQPR